MSEAAAVSALNGARFKGTVMVQEEPPQGMITLRGDLSSKAMAAAVGVTVPGVNAVVYADQTELLWMAPDELMLLCPYADVSARLVEITASLDGTHHLAVDVSDARVVFTLSGEGVREVLAKLTPADMSPAAFAPGQLRRTRLAQVPAAVWMRDPINMQVICFRSVAQYVFDILKGAASPQAELQYF